MKKIFLLAALAMSLSSILSAPQAEALSCVQPPSPEEEFNQSIAVFSGKVVKTDNVGAPGSNSGRNYADFEVHKVWKGSLPQGLTVETDGLWGMQFQEGKEYLVYLDKLDPYTVELCRFGTTELSQAGDRIGGIEARGVSAQEPTQSQGSSNARIVVIYGGGILLVIATYLLLRRSGK